MPIGFPTADDVPEIGITPGPVPYQTFSQIGTQFRPLGQTDHEAEARRFSENVEAAKADEEMRRAVSREVQADQYIAYIRGLGVAVNDEMAERIRSQARK